MSSSRTTCCSKKTAENYVKLERVNELFENTIRTRLNNPKKGSIVVIAHRLNKDDLPGHLLNEGGWKHLKLPLIAPRSRAYDIEDGKKWHRKKGEVLRPGAFTKRDIQKLRASCKIFELLYQQNSNADERLRITPEHFPRFTGSPVTFANAPVVISIDPGQKHGPETSFSVIQVFSPWNGKYYLRDQWRQQACWSDLLAACKKLIRRYRAGTVLIEDTGMGSSLLDVLNIPHVDLVRIKQPHVDKVERLRPHRRTICNGLIELPAGADWLDDFLDEFTLFPHAPDTDQVDATTQFLTWIKAHPHPKVLPPPPNAVAIGSQGPLSPAPNEHDDTCKSQVPCSSVGDIGGSTNAAAETACDCPAGKGSNVKSLRYRGRASRGLTNKSLCEFPRLAGASLRDAQRGDNGERQGCRSRRLAAIVARCARIVLLTAPSTAAPVDGLNRKLWHHPNHGSQVFGATAHAVARGFRNLLETSEPGPPPCSDWPRPEGHRLSLQRSAGVEPSSSRAVAHIDPRNNYLPRCNDATATNTAANPSGTPMA